MSRLPARWRRGALVALALLLVLVLALVGLSRQQERTARARGEALYLGQAGLRGQLAGHDTALPTIATRCSNCHEPGQAAPPPGASGSLFAGALVATSLAAPRSRRGGPPSVYDAARLCTLLRNGIDPAQVMIDSTMPRYQPTDAQCEDLWTYLRSR